MTDILDTFTTLCGTVKMFASAAYLTSTAVQAYAGWIAKYCDFFYFWLQNWPYIEKCGPNLALYYITFLRKDLGSIFNKMTEQSF